VVGFRIRCRRGRLYAQPPLKTKEICILALREAEEAGVRIADAILAANRLIDRWTDTTVAVIRHRGPLAEAGKCIGLAGGDRY